MPLSIGEGPNGKPKVVAVDEEGRVQVDAEISTSAGPIEVVVAEQQTATALPEPGTSGIVTHIVPTGPQEPEASIAVVISNQELQIAGATTLQTRARNATDAGFPTSRVVDADVRALDVTAVGGATEAKQDEAIAVGQGIAAKIPALVDDQIPVVAAGVEAAVASLEAEVADDATTGDVQEVRDRLPQEGGRLAVETELSAAGPLVTEATATSTLAAVDTLEANTDQIESKLGTLAAQEATTAKDTSVDGLEALATTGNAHLAALAAVLGPEVRTAFGRIRTATSRIAHRNVQTYALDTRTWDTQTANGGAVAYNATTGRTDMSVTGTSGSLAVMQTHVHFLYEPPAVTRPIMTVVLGGAGAANLRCRWGLFNQNDGLFWERNGTTLYLVRRTSTSGSPVDSVLAQSSWDDTFAGLDLTKGSRYEIDLQWLSFGDVHFRINGRLVHTWQFANGEKVPAGNNDALPSMRTAQLPLRLELECTGASSAATMHYVCSEVEWDGGDEGTFVPDFHRLSTPKTGIGTSFTPVLGLRVAELISGRANRAIFLPALARVSNASGRCTVALVLNPSSTTGGTWSAAGLFGGLEYNEGITSYTGGNIITDIHLPLSIDTRELDARHLFTLPGMNMRRNAFNTDGDVLLIVAAADNATTDVVALSLNWHRHG